MPSTRRPAGKRRDRTNFCARCGVTFLWTIEEQTHIEATDSEATDTVPVPAEQPTPGDGNQDVQIRDGAAASTTTGQTTTGQTTTGQESSSVPEDQTTARKTPADDHATADRQLPRRAVRPSLCPGCRRLLPAEGRERGLVKWYNRRKRFGFITRKDQPDIFVHGSALKSMAHLGTRHLYPDMLVEFSVDETDRGLAAGDVEVLATEEAPQTTS